jgi:NAD+ kinase
LKFAVYAHPQRPKIKQESIENLVVSLGLQISKSNPDIALVIGGDGTFSYYGRRLSVPMLFVGVPTSEILGSKSRLAKVSIHNLPEALQGLKKGNYVITERRMLEVIYEDYSSTSVLTDVYLERGIFAGCIRYSVTVTNNSNKTGHRANSSSGYNFTDFVIGNGVIISTSFGSGGYYSYLDRIKRPKKRPITLFNDSRLGICHILPTFGARRLKDNKEYEETIPIRYTVPFDSIIEIKIIRETNSRLYGTTIHSKGIKISWNKPIIVTSSPKIAKIIHLT